MSSGVTIALAKYLRMAWYAEVLENDLNLINRKKEIFRREWEKKGGQTYPVGQSDGKTVQIVKIISCEDIPDKCLIFWNLNYRTKTHSVSLENAETIEIWGWYTVETDNEEDMLYSFEDNEIKIPHLPMMFFHSKIELLDWIACNYSNIES